MYHPKVIEQKLKVAAGRLGVTPERRDPAYCWNFAEHLDKLTNPETGKFRRALPRQETDHIRSERLICKHDFLYWTERYAWISDRENKLTRIKPNIAQRLVTDIWADLELKGREITLMELKARQLGMTTWTELAIAHRVPFYPQVNALVSSSNQQKSEKMAEIMTLCWSKQPHWLLPEMTTNNRYVKGFGAINSGVSIQHGAQTSGIARGTTPTVAHLSEVSQYDNPYELIDGSLMRAMHPSPRIFLILESTAIGRKNWWHDTWESSKEKYHLGEARLFPVFLPWYIGKDLYPTETDLEKWRQIFAEQGKSLDDWQPNAVTELHTMKAEEYVRSNPTLRKYLGLGWRMTKEQMMWWQFTRAEYARKKALAQFYMEMPASDAEAFQSTALTVFDQELLVEIRDSAEARSPKAVLGISGQDIPQRLWPARRELIKDLPSVTVDPAHFRLRMAHPLQLSPVKWSGWSDTDPLGKVIVYEWPEDGYEYCLGVDTSDGIGEDRSVIEVVRKGDHVKNDAQVAEFASSYVNSYDLWPIVAALGCLYTVVYRGHRRQPKVSIECHGNGETTQLELKKRGWTHFHWWRRYDNRRMTPSNKMGWFTTFWSRPLLMDFGTKSVRDGWVNVNSPWLVSEFEELERDETRQAAKAMYGGHDDRVMAFFIALFTLYELEIKGEEALPKSRQQRLLYREMAEGRRQKDYPRYNPGWQVTGVPRGPDGREIRQVLIGRPGGGR